MTTEELAERLYVAWRERMDFVDPQPYGKTTSRDSMIGESPAYRLRPAWNRLPPNEQTIWKYVADRAADLVSRIDGMSAPHFHRCKECRELMNVGCVDTICAEGVRWVVLCLRCYERMLEAVGEPV